MATNPEQDHIRTLGIEKRYFEAQKIGDADLRWLFARSERLVAADSLLTANGFEISHHGKNEAGDDVWSIQPPLGAAGDTWRNG